MQFEFGNVLVFLVLGGGIIFATLLIGKLIRPSVASKQKRETYECGEHPIQSAWFNFNPRFYIIALVFLIFEVEVVFTYPVGVVFQRWVREGAGGIAFVEIGLFVAILLLGLAYVWRMGDLAWIRPPKAEPPRDAR